MTFFIVGVIGVTTTMAGVAGDLSRILRSTKGPY